MGIYHFFVWFKKNFSANIQRLPEGTNVDVKIDNLFIDMNGLFHNAAQKIYEYGSFKPRVRLLNKKPKNERQLQKEVFIEVCNNIDTIFYTVNPTKRLVLCVDGSAPACKMNQQRQRRFKNSDEDKDGSVFNSHNITPGTVFMDNLSKYIDWYIKKQISENPLWRDIEVIFSNEKVPCEGEGKIFSYIRKNLQHNSESCCLHGSDADLIMLSLGTHLDNFYILRDETYDKSIKFLFINISEVSSQLSDMMKWESEKYEYDSNNAIDDFIFLCIAENTPISLMCGLSIPIQMITNNKFPILSFNEKETETNIITSYFSNVINENGKYKLKITDPIYGHRTLGLEQDEIEIGAVGPNNKGKQTVYKLTLLDGRELMVTPNHEIRTCRGYIKAKELNYGYNNTVISKDNSKYIVVNSKLVNDSEFIGSNIEKSDCCLMGPDTFRLDIEDEINNIYSLDMSNIKNLTFQSVDDIYRSLAFSRILGYIYADGTILSNGCRVCIGHKLDVVEIQKDIKIICGKINKPYWSTILYKSQIENIDDKETYNFGCWVVTLPTDLYKSILNLPGIMKGKRSIQKPSFPNYLFDILTPSCMIREFMAGFFGGDGGTISMSSDFKNITNSIPLSQYIIPKYSEDLQNIYKSLSILLKEKLDITSCVRGPYTHKDTDRIQWTLVINSSLEFSDKIGFRYCYSKQIRLSVACCWFRFRNNTMKQKKEMLKILYNESKNTENYRIPSLFKKLKFINNIKIADYKNLSRNELRKYCSELGIVSIYKTKSELIKDINNYFISIPITHPFIDQKLNGIPVLSIYSQFTQENLAQYIRNILFKNNILNTEASFKSFINFIEDEYKDIDIYLKQCKFDIGQEITFKDFIEKIGAIHVFSKHTHWPERNDLNIPTYNLPIINIEKLEYDINVYDLTIKNNHSFLANSCVVHNCFMLGNDFLPHIPSLEIIENGVDIILNVYRDVCTFNGHITKNLKGNITFQKNSLKIFLEMISRYEKQILENKLKNKRLYFQDDLLESCAIYNNAKGEYELDIKKYRTEYIQKNFFNDGEIIEKELKKIAHSYIEGLQFVISYYTSEVPNWEWSYKYYYAPPAIILAKYIDTFSMPKYKKTCPLLPFEQLLHVLPPSSSNLLPYPLYNLFLDDSSPLKEFYPDKFEIDLAGKKNDYQGILILPFVDINKIKTSYLEKKSLINFKDLKRNCQGKTFLYKYDSNLSYTFSSYFGNFICRSQINFIDI